MFVEVEQIWLPSRNPSTSDLLMNIVGTLLGALSARSMERRFRSDPEGFRLRIRKNAAPLAVIAYALALLASTMRTFDPILNWRALGIRAGAFVGSPLFLDHLDLDYTVWMIITFGFLSFFVAEVFADSSMIRRRLVGYAGAFVSCSLFAVALEAMQVLFRSRHPLLSHALLGIIGVAYGIAWHAVYESGNSRASLVIPLFFLHYTLLIFLAFLSPIPHSIGDFRFDLRGFIPLFFYLRDISMPSLYAATKAIILYIPMGIIIHWPPDAIRDRTWKISVGFSVGLQAIIEISRGISGYQYPDPSNVLLAALGAYAGIRLLKILRTPG